MPSLSELQACFWLPIRGMQDQGICLPRVRCLYQKMYAVWEMCRQRVSRDISFGEHLPYLSAYWSAACRFTSLWKIDVLFYPSDGYSPNIAFLLLMPPSMWGNLTIFLTRKRTKRKIQFAISGSAADGIVKKEKKNKKIRKTQKWKDGFAIELWAVGSAKLTMEVGDFWLKYFFELFWNGSNFVLVQSAWD